MEWHVYQFVVGGCDVWVRLVDRKDEPGFWCLNTLVTSGAFKALDFSPRSEWCNTDNPEYVPPGSYKRSTPFTGWHVIDPANVDKLMWNTIEAFAQHYRAFGSAYGIRIEDKRSYADSGPFDGSDHYKQANVEGDALMKMDEIELEITQLQLQVEAAVELRNDAIRRWNELNDKCGPRRRAPRRVK